MGRKRVLEHVLACGARIRPLAPLNDTVMPRGEQVDPVTNLKNLSSSSPSMFPMYTERKLKTVVEQAEGLQLQI